MRQPALRALLGPTGFVVVPWHRGLSLAQYALGPQERNPLLALLGSSEEARHHGPDPQRYAMLDVWLEEHRTYARHVGASSEQRERGAEFLAIWLREHHHPELEIGPDLPDWLPVPLNLQLPTTPSRAAPAFRFTHLDSLDLRPWGFGAPENTERLIVAAKDAVGEVHALDDDRAVARVAHLGTQDRDDVVSALRSWAAADDWQLEIASGLQPLTVPTPTPQRVDPGRCSRCGVVAAGGWAYSMAQSRRGYALTRCGLCGGRMWWHVRRLKTQEDRRA